MIAKNLRAIYLACIIFLASIAPNTKAQETTDQVFPRISIENIQISGNTIFSDQEIKEILLPFFKNNSIPPQKLLEIVPKITELYVEQGFISSGAFLPPQIQEDNTQIEIRIIEGKLSSIEFRKNEINEKFLRERLPKANQILNINDISKSLNKLKRNALIKEIKGEIIEESLGENILIVDTTKNPSSFLEINFSNQFSPTIGEFGFFTIFSQLNIFKIHDQLNLEYFQSQGLNRFKGEYSFLITNRDTKLLLSYTIASSEVITEELEELEIEADFQGFNISLEQPLFLSTKNELNLTTGFRHIDSETFVLEDLSFSFIEGLENGETRNSSLYFSQEFSRRNSNSFLFIRSNFDIGIDAFNATQSFEGADGIFWKWRGDFQYLYSLDDSNLFLSKFLLQLSPDNLLPVETLTIGGKGTVRGYRRNLISADNGAIGSLEFQFRLLESKKVGAFAIVPFVDYAVFWNNSDDDLPSNALLATGLTLKYDFSSFFKAELDLGFPLIAPEGFGSESTTDNLVFSLKFFPLEF